MYVSALTLISVMSFYHIPEIDSFILILRPRLSYWMKSNRKSSVSSSAGPFTGAWQGTNTAKNLRRNWGGEKCF